MKREKRSQDLRTKKEKLEAYNAVGNIPHPWFIKGDELLASEKTLVENCPFIHSGNIKSHNCVGVILMLRGMALECYFKGVLTKQGTIFVRDGKMEGPKNWDSHNLLKLAREVERLELTEDESSMLTTLSDYIVYGRLPLRKRFRETPKFKTLHWSVPSDEDLFNSVFNKLITVMER